MKLPRRNFLHLAAGAVALPAVSRDAWAQAYPSRPVRCSVTLVPRTAGGAKNRRAALGRALLTPAIGLPASVTDRAMEAWYHPSIA